MFLYRILPAGKCISIYLQIQGVMSITKWMEKKGESEEQWEEVHKLFDFMIIQ
jgi:uncharacterized pyridoxal phosphate-containing UPF0001 family protein